MSSATLKKQCLNNLGRAFVAIFILILGDIKAPSNQRFYLERTEIPQIMKSREWIKRLQVLNLFVSTPWEAEEMTSDIANQYSNAFPQTFQ